jgi:phosphoribosyl-ATP pyrophosphohydrolase/phosphoribosyl-AMP cyclohydrolase
MDLDALRFDERGLVPVVAQDSFSGEIRMLAYANREALVRTIETREAVFFSRSRGALWKKGEESGNVMRVHEVWTDCDADAVVYLVDPAGPTCHTGRECCFFERLDSFIEADGSAIEAERADGDRALPLLARLDIELRARAHGDSAKSYTKSLLDAGPTKIAAKVREEGGELAAALESESTERVVSEAADVLYHVMVGLLSRGASVRDVEVELGRRFGISGHDEKASRSPAARTKD